MAADLPFSLDQLDPESRALAERAARAAGLTLEEWVTRAILRKTGGQAPAPAPAAPAPIQAPPPRTVSPQAPPPAARPAPAPPQSTPPAPAASPPKERPASAALSDKDLLAALSALGPTGDAGARLRETPPAAPTPTPPRPAELTPEQRATTTKELEELKRALERIGTASGTAASAPSETRAPAPSSATHRFPTFSNTLRSPSDATPGMPEPAAKPERPNMAAPKFEPEPNIASNLEAALRAFPGAASTEDATPRGRETGASEPLELDQPLAQDERAEAGAGARTSLLRREDEDEEGEPELERAGSGFWRVVLILLVLILLGGAAATAYMWAGKGGTNLDIMGLIDRITGTATPPAVTPAPTESAKPVDSAKPAEPTPAPSAPVEATKPSEPTPPAAAPAASPATPAAPHSEAIPPAAAPGVPRMASAPPPGVGAGASIEAPVTAPPATSAPGPPKSGSSVSVQAPKGKPGAREETVTSFDQIEKLAKKGDAHAQHDIATLYARGTEIPQDYKKATYWFRESALQGVASSQYNLGVLYEQGLGIDKDALEALLWYLSAAEQGYAPAQYNVGVAYADGKGVPKNYLEARKWFEKAADLGIGRSAYNLGVLNELGLGAAADPLEAYKWYKIAERDGEADSKGRIDAMKQKMSPTQLADAERRYQSVASTIPSKPVPFEERTNGSAPVRALLPPSASNGTALPTREVAAVRATPPGTAPASSGGVESTGTSRPILVEIQQLLGALGYDPGPADGHSSAKTIAAIRTFQQEAGLPVDGKVTPQLLGQIRKLAGKT